jgi:hypothetical protein
MDIIKFKTDIRNLLMTKRLYNFEKTVYFSELNNTYLNILLPKILINYKYQLYYNVENYFNNSSQYYYPMFDIDKQCLSNISFDMFKKFNNIDIIILPIIIFDHKNESGHIIVCYINFKYKHVLFYDSYGINKIYSKNISKLIMKFLKENKIVDNSFKYYMVNCPWQNYVKDDTNTWLYDSSCLIIISLFTYLYFYINTYASSNKNFCKLIIDFSKSIKKDNNLEIIKDLIMFTYVAVKEG